MSETAKKTIFLLYGENSYSSHEKLKFYQNGFLKKYGDEGDMQVLDGKKLNISQFITDLEAIPFLTEKRLLIVKNFLTTSKTDDQKKVAENIEKTPDFCIVIFHENGTPDRTRSLYKRIKKIGHVEEFKPFQATQISNWIKEKSQRIGLNIKPMEINYLIQHAGNDLWKLSNELTKLKTYNQDQQVTKAIIDELTTPCLTSSVFKLTDNISSKNIKEALKTLQILTDSGEDPMKIFFMIVRHFRILIQVHEMVGKRESEHTIIQKLKQHPFVIKKTSHQAKNFSEEKLAGIFKQFLQIDRDFKTGRIKTYQSDNREYILAIEKLIIDCCQ